MLKNGGNKSAFATSLIFVSVGISARNSPPLAGDDAHLFTVPFWRHSPGLPPLIIRCIDDMEDVSISETETLTGQTTILRPLIVKQSPGETHIHISFTDLTNSHNISHPSVTKTVTKICH